MAKKILVVDDEPDLLKIATFRLKKSGYETLTAVNGKEALELIHKEKLDLILLDILLPMISGYEICKDLKKDDKFKNIPVILFTANTINIAEKYKEAGAEDYLIKPFDTEELLKKVKKFIG